MADPGFDCNEFVHDVKHKIDATLHEIERFAQNLERQSLKTSSESMIKITNRQWQSTSQQLSAIPEQISKILVTGGTTLNRVVKEYESSNNAMRKKNEEITKKEREVDDIKQMREALVAATIALNMEKNDLTVRESQSLQNAKFETQQARTAEKDAVDALKAIRDQMEDKDAELVNSQAVHNVEMDNLRKSYEDRLADVNGKINNIKALEDKVARARSERMAAVDSERQRQEKKQDTLREQLELKQAVIEAGEAGMIKQLTEIVIDLKMTRRDLETTRDTVGRDVSGMKRKLDDVVGAITRSNTGTLRQQGNFEIRVKSIHQENQGAVQALVKQVSDKLRDWENLVGNQDTIRKEITTFFQDWLKGVPNFDSLIGEMAGAKFAFELALDRVNDAINHVNDYEALNKHMKEVTDELTDYRMDERLDGAIENERRARRKEVTLATMALREVVVAVSKSLGLRDPYQDEDERVGMAFEEGVRPGWRPFETYEQITEREVVSPTVRGLSSDSPVERTSQPIESIETGEKRAGSPAESAARKAIRSAEHLPGSEGPFPRSTRSLPGTDPEKDPATSVRTLASRVKNTLSRKQDVRRTPTKKSSFASIVRGLGSGFRHPENRSSQATGQDQRPGSRPFSRGEGVRRPVLDPDLFKAPESTEEPVVPEIARGQEPTLATVVPSNQPTPATIIPSETATAEDLQTLSNIYPPARWTPELQSLYDMIRYNGRWSAREKQRFREWMLGIMNKGTIALVRTVLNEVCTGAQREFGGEGKKCLLQAESRQGASLEKTGVVDREDCSLHKEDGLFPNELLCVKIEYCQAHFTSIVRRENNTVDRVASQANRSDQAFMHQTDREGKRWNVWLRRSGAQTLDDLN